MSHHAVSRRPRFGVNYTPSRNWWYCWVDWDHESIRHDLQAIAALGMDHIRIHCLWPVFQPNATMVSPTAIQRLVELMDLADTCGLDVQVAVLDGWLSGFCFCPSWQGRKNMFTDPTMIAAEELLLSTLAREIGGHRRFLGFDLGNELGVMMFFGNPATIAESDQWMQRMFAVVENASPGKLHVNGVDHLHWFRDFGFSRKALATTGSATSVHAWCEFTGFSSRFGADSTQSMHLAEYCIELVKAYHDDVSRPIWLQEFGASSHWMSPERIPVFAEQTIRAAATCANLWGCTWWCSHDLNPQLTGFAPLEYDLGLFDSSNRPKPAAHCIQKLIREMQISPPQPASRTRALVLPDTCFAPDNSDPALNFADSWCQHIQNGSGPAVVLESRSQDNTHLQSRGIQELIRPR